MHLIIVHDILPFISLCMICNSDLKEVMKKIKDVSVNLNSSVVHQILVQFDVPVDDSETLPSDLYSVCQLWLSATADPNLATLIRALLCTQGLGHLVTGLVPICEVL